MDEVILPISKQHFVVDSKIPRIIDSFHDELELLRNLMRLGDRRCSKVAVEDKCLSERGVAWG